MFISSYNKRAYIRVEGVTQAPNDTAVMDFLQAVNNLQDNIQNAYVQYCTSNRVDLVLEQSFKCDGVKDYIDFSKKRGYGIIFMCTK